MKITNWLALGGFLIYAMLVIGCITRLTHSGLSITRWSLFGTFPPLNDNDWAELFRLYQNSPEYQKVNSGMELEEFKSIYFWEYLHRMTGRLLGFVFLAGFLFFLIKRELNRSRLMRFSLLFFLGLLQGLIGWWMVKSGLVDKPSVSHYRLAVHLLSAFTLFGLTYWNYLIEKSAISGKQDAFRYAFFSRNQLKKIYLFYFPAFIFLVLQIIYGAFTAGFTEGNQSKIRPGNIFNTWPLMGETWFPAEHIFRYDSLWKNLTENAPGIQFVHRWLGFAVMICILFMAWYSRKWNVKNVIYNDITWLVYAVVLQILLGIYTLIENVPVYMGVLHQSGAFLLFLLMVQTGFHLYKANKTHSVFSQTSSD